jgi:hypothetical protein
MLKLVQLVDLRKTPFTSPLEIQAKLMMKRLTTMSEMILKRMATILIPTVMRISLNNL